MSFRQLTALISREVGVTPGVTPYRAALWRDAHEHDPETATFRNMVLWEAALRGNHSALAAAVAAGGRVDAQVYMIYLYLYLNLSINLSVCLSVCLSIYRSIYRSIYLSIDLSISRSRL